MQPTALSHAVAQTRTAEQVARAGSVRAAAVDTRPANRARALSDVTIRFARPDEVPALRRLAELDGRGSRWEPRDVLVAEVDGHIEAAWSMADSRAVADPFHYTDALVALLKTRARQLTDGRRSNRRAVTRLVPGLS